MTRLSCCAVAVLLLGVSACADTNRSITPPESIDAQLRQAISQTYGVVPIAPMPAQDPAKVALGQALFFDKILSGNKDIACATCHLPQQHLQDGLSLAIGTGGVGEGPARTLGPGHQFHARSAPSLLNDGLGLVYVFADGRVQGFRGGPFQTPAGAALPPDLPNILAAQALFPVLNRQEMRGDSGDVDALGAPNELAQYGDSQLADIWHGVMSTRPRRSPRSSCRGSPRPTRRSTATWPATTPRSPPRRSVARCCSSGRRSARAATTARCWVGRVLPTRERRSSGPAWARPRRSISVAAASPPIRSTSSPSASCRCATSS